LSSLDTFRGGLEALRCRVLPERRVYLVVAPGGWAVIAPIRFSE
jgi:hypothetical protein